MSVVLYQPKRDRLLYLARPTAVTLTCDAPILKALRPGALFLKDRILWSFILLVLALVESFPGAQSPLGSKEPIELFPSFRKVVVSLTPPKLAR